MDEEFEGEEDFDDEDDELGEENEDDLAGRIDAKFVGIANRIDNKVTSWFN